MSSQFGKLYVVATPIGNLADFSYRGVETLKQVDLIAAEDTRHVRMLMQHYGISNKVIALHQHNEDKASPGLVEKMLLGSSIALVSDAGTPLLSDPGLPLVKMALEAEIQVTPVPGACALIAALSAAGLATSEFTFSGFLPRTSSARKTFFSEKKHLLNTWIFYESSHRILNAIIDLAEVLPAHREIVIARELTKLYETILRTTVGEAAALIELDANMQRGEFVVVVQAAEAIHNETDQLDREQERILSVLLRECSTKTAVAMAVEITGARKKTLYQTALRLAKSQQIE